MDGISPAATKLKEYPKLLAEVYFLDDAIERPPRAAEKKNWCSFNLDCIFRSVCLLKILVKSSQVTLEVWLRGIAGDYWLLWLNVQYGFRKKFGLKYDFTGLYQKKQ